jgi:hypothetical protein
LKGIPKFFHALAVWGAWHCMCRVNLDTAATWYHTGGVPRKAKNWMTFVAAHILAAGVEPETDNQLVELAEHAHKELINSLSVRDMLRGELPPSIVDCLRDKHAELIQAERRESYKAETEAARTARLTADLEDTIDAGSGSCLSPVAPPTAEPEPLPHPGAGGEVLFGITEIAAASQETVTGDVKPPFPGHGVILSDLPDTTYHAIDALSSTAIKRALDCLWEYRNPEDIGDKPPVRIGTAGHKWLLECKADNAASNEAIGILPVSGCKVARGKAWNEGVLQAAETGRLPLTLDEWETLCKAIDAASRNAFLMRSLDGATVEQSMFWVETIDGVEIPCKARIDAMTASGSMIDAKFTGRGTSPAAYKRYLEQYDLVIQSGWYERGRQRCGLEPSKGHYHALIPTKRPWVAEVHPVPDGAVQRANEIITDKVLPMIAKERSGVPQWGGYSQGANGEAGLCEPVSLGDWYWRKFEQQRRKT